jgi:DNA adenine methylase
MEAVQTTFAVSSLRPLDPPLKWAGGKRWLVRTLRPLFAPYQHRRLVDVFCGGLAVPLGLLPAQSLCNDINPHLINFYRWLQRGLEISFDLRNDQETYYQYRAWFNSLVVSGTEDSPQAAALFYYLNRTGYNGLCRFNSRGEFNVPFGRYKSITYNSDFLGYRDLLRQWTFNCGDFEQIRTRPDDFIYADPPYDVEFTRYSREDFTWADQQRLAAWLANHPGPTVASNQATERVVDLYQLYGFRIIFLTGPRRISCTGDRTPAREILALKGL